MSWTGGPPCAGSISAAMRGHQVQAGHLWFGSLKKFVFLCHTRFSVEQSISHHTQSRIKMQTQLS
jgi:hypothetical protein